MKRIMVAAGVAALLTTPAQVDAQEPPSMSDVIVIGVLNHPFFRCVRWRESDRATRTFDPARYYINGRTAKNPGSSSSGHFQWIDSSWRNAALAIGRTDIAYQPAREASTYDQFLVTGAYFARAGGGRAGARPWALSGSICNRYV